MKTKQVTADTISIAKAIIEHHIDYDEYPDSYYQHQYECLFCDAETLVYRHYSDLPKNVRNHLKHEKGCPVLAAKRLLKHYIQECKE